MNGSIYSSLGLRWANLGGLDVAQYIVPWACTGIMMYSYGRFGKFHSLCECLENTKPLVLRGTCSDTF